MNWRKSTSSNTEVPHLNIRLPFTKLPVDVQQEVIHDYETNRKSNGTNLKNTVISQAIL